jgi:hypothetical protein
LAFFRRPTRYWHWQLVCSSSVMDDVVEVVVLVAAKVRLVKGQI